MITPPNPKQQIVLDALTQGLTFDQACDAADYSHGFDNRSALLRRFLDNGYISITVQAKPAYLRSNA